MTTCPLCGRETMKNRIQHPPPMSNDEAEQYCLHPNHIYSRELPPCEQRGVERIAALEAELQREKRATEKAILTGGCRACVEDSRGPHGTAKHTCDASERHAANYQELVTAVSSWKARAERAEAEIAASLTTMWALESERDAATRERDEARAELARRSK